MLLAVLSAPAGSHALIRFEDAVFPELATSARALAMGNAFVSKVDDGASAFYNPAGLGTVRRTHFHLSNFHVESNAGWMEHTLGGDLDEYVDGFAEGFSVNGHRKLFKRKARSRLMSARFHVVPNLTTRYFSLGYLLARQLRTAYDPGADLFEYASRQDHGPWAGLNLSLMGGVLKVGASAVMLERKELFGEGGIDDRLSYDDKNLPFRKGEMVHVVAGAKLTLPIAWLPTFSATLHNPGEEPFEREDGTEATGEDDIAEIERNLVAGFSLTPWLTRWTRMHLEVNYRDLERAHRGIENVRRLALGLELDMSRRFFLRLGYGDGFGSGGLGFRVRRMQFDLTTYAVDTTAKDWRGSEDRRFAVSMSAGI